MAVYPRVVYMITHNHTKKMYIGSTSNFRMRIKNHLNELRAGRHNVEDMQDDFNKYGENYTIEIIDEIKLSESFRKEYDYMEQYNSRIRGIGYNYKDNHALHKGGVG